MFLTVEELEKLPAWNKFRNSHDVSAVSKGSNKPKATE